MTLLLNCYVRALIIAHFCLQKGETVRLSDGTVVRPEDVLEPEQHSKVCILGDSCDSSNMVQIAPKCRRFGARSYIRKQVWGESRLVHAFNRGHGWRLCEDVVCKSVGFDALQQEIHEF